MEAAGTGALMQNRKTLYLHIGQDKAGSTAIQGFLYRNYGALNQYGYDLPGGRVWHHGPVHASVVNGDLEQLRSATEYMRRSESTRFIMSFEGFYALREDLLKLFLKHLRDFRLIVVFYVRRRSDKFRSGFAQNLRLEMAGKVKDAHNLVHGKLDEFDPVFEKGNMNYLAIVRRWQRHLSDLDGNNLFKLRVFEKSSLIEGDLLTDFGRSIDLFKTGETPETRPFVRPKKQPNPSLSPAAQYLTVFSKLLRPTSEQSVRLAKLLEACDSPGANRLSLVPEKVAESLDKRYRADDKTLAKEFFGRSRLFRERPTLRYGAPDGKAFVSLINEMAKLDGLFDAT